MVSLKVRIKVCGITNLKDAQACVNAGCDALGFVFYKKSPRYITPTRARIIVKELPKNIVKIGVFVDAKEKTIRRIIRLCSLNMLQFHGNEPPEFCKRFINYKVIKAFRIKNKIDWKEISRYQTFGYLFDTFVRSKAGGTGKKFNWKLIEHIKGIKQQIFLSGGLDERNVNKAIRIIKPAWVDVSSSIEIESGKKDYNKVENFIKAVRKVAF